jgi:hypothetical protein
VAAACRVAVAVFVEPEGGVTPVDPSQAANKIRQKSSIVVHRLLILVLLISIEYPFDETKNTFFHMILLLQGSLSIHNNV